MGKETMSELQQNHDKFGVLPFIFGGLSFIPLCGVPFGLIAVVWGLLSNKRGSKILAMIGALGIATTVALYGGLYYFGFIQRGGIYDSLRVRLAESNLTNLVQAIEFYKLQNSEYPSTLDVLSNSQPQEQPLFVMDPTTMVGPDQKPRQFYYELTNNGSNYYLLGVGADGIPFTSDDLLPKNDPKNTGLVINPGSKPAP